MASLDRRADKQQRKPAHAQERTQAREVVPATPQPPPDAKAPEPESQTPQDKLGAVLMALAGRTPDAMPQALAWTRAGAVTVLPQREHAVLPQAEVRARWLDQPPGRADAVLQALTGAIGHAVPTRDPAALWMALRAAIADWMTSSLVRPSGLPSVAMSFCMESSYACSRDSVFGFKVGL